MIRPARILAAVRLLPACAALAILGWAAAGASAGGGPPSADFDWSPNPAIAGEPTLFTATDDRLTDHAWDLDGDGVYGDAVGPRATRTFDASGSYTVGLRALDEEATPREMTNQVTVIEPRPPPPDDPPRPPNQPPSASFVFFPAGPIAGDSITFVSTSTDPDSPISKSGLDWDLDGDGRFDDAEGPTATAPFPQPGTFLVALRVTTNATDVASLVLNVGSPGAPPAASVGQRALSLMSPFPIVRIAGRISRRGVRIRRLTIDAPPGAAVKLRCGGRRCPFKRLLRTISARVRAGGGLPPTRLLRIRRLERRLLRPGVTLRLYVTSAGAVGKYTRFKIRKARAPVRRDRCLVPGNPRPLPCPSR